MCCKMVPVPDGMSEQRKRPERKTLLSELRLQELGDVCGRSEPHTGLVWIYSFLRPYPSLHTTHAGKSEQEQVVGKNMKVR